ncbi:MAG: hypothetical protein HYY50_00235 [Candidatus Kerfeldbacteria bacterium]|nr:hypothetical protein [Candidatus Kerfeldbacteria bacterium]
MNQRRKGMITLISILVLAAVGGAVAVSLLLLGVDATRTSSSREFSAAARALANACVETALEEIRSYTPFTTAGTNLNIGSGTCTYVVANTGGFRRTIQASGSMGSVSRKVLVTVDRINPTIRVTSWQEVGDF